MKKVSLEAIKIGLTVLLTLTFVLPYISFRLAQQQILFCDLLSRFRSVDMEFGRDPDTSYLAVAEKMNDSFTYCDNGISLSVDLTQSPYKVGIGNRVLGNDISGFYRVGTDLQIRFVNENGVTIAMRDLSNVVRSGDIVHIVFGLVPPKNYVFWSDPSNGLWITIEHLNNN